MVGAGAPKRATAWRVAAAAGATLLLFVPVAAILAARVPNIDDTPLASAVPDGDDVAVDLTLKPAVGDRKAFLAMDAPAGGSWLPGVDAIDLRFATYETSPTLIRGVIDTPNGTCRFVAVRVARIANNGLVRFTRDGACRLTSASPRLWLTLRVGSSGRVALWTYAVPMKEFGAGRIVFKRNGGAGYLPRGRAIAPRQGDAPRRIALLAFVWSGALGMRGIAAWIGALAGAFGAGAWLALGSGARPRVAGAALAAFAIAATWAVVMPPLQAADEPNHLLSFARVVNDDILPERLAELARRTHFERIRFNADEHFRPGDVDRPYAVAWDAQVHAENTSARSPFTADFWRALSAALHLPGRPPFEIVLRIRLADALLFGLAVGLAAAVVLWGDHPAGSLWALAPIAFVPALPYFPMPVSEWSGLVTVTVVWAVGLRLLWRDNVRSDAAGLVIGASYALLLTSGAAALALAPLLAAALVGRIVLGPSASDRPWWRAAIFWGGLAAGLALAFPLVDTIFLHGYHRGDVAGVEGNALIAFLNRALDLVARAPWLVVLALTAAAAAELALGAVRRSNLVRQLGRALAAAAATVIAVWAIAVWVSSWWIDDSALPLIETSGAPTAVAYARIAVAHFLTSVRATHPDFLLFMTFWSGFGWLETRLPGPVMASLAAALVCGIAATVAWLARGRRFRSLGWFDMMTAGVIASVAAIAIADYALHRNVHGRYLIGAYVPLVLLAGQALTAIPTTVRGRIARGVVACLLLTLHAASVVVVLTRYF